MTLKIGDRVRFRKSFVRDYSGETGTVVAAEPQFNNYEVLPDNGARYGPGCAKHEGAGSFEPADLEKIEPEPKFKAGDRVRRRRPHPRWTTGTVVGHSPVGGVIVKPDTYKYPRGCAPREHEGAGSFDAGMFEKIEEAPRPLGLRPGDKVVNLKTGREGLVLKGPISGELKVYDQKPPVRDAVPAAALEEYEHWHPGTYDVWRRVTEKKKAQPW